MVISVRDAEGSCQSWELVGSDAQFAMCSGGYIVRTHQES